MQRRLLKVQPYQSKNKIYFPSYQKIKGKIAEESRLNFKKATQKIKHKIERIKSSINMEAMHQKFVSTLLNKQNKVLVANICQGTISDENGVKWDDTTKNNQKKKAKFLNHSQLLKTFTKKDDVQMESLNRLIQDDYRAQNHYESYMKFRKRILQRQLQDKQQQQENLTQKSFKKGHNKQHGHNSKTNYLTLVKSLMNYKQRQTEEQLFRNLYSSEKMQKGIKTVDSCSTQASAKCSQFHTRRNSEAKNPPAQIDRMQKIQQNKKVLLSTYGKYVHDLRKTHTVKWRILQEQNNIKRQSVIVDKGHGINRSHLFTR